MTNATAVESPQSEFGIVRKMPDGSDQVVFERHYPASVERVWAVITGPEHLRVWVPGIEFEAKLGGAFRMWFSQERDGPAHINDEVRAFEPPHVLQLGSMRFELEREGDGCLLRFSDILFYDNKRTKTQFANSVLGGWHRYLNHLSDYVHGRPVDFVTSEPDYASRDVEGRS